MEFFYTQQMQLLLFIGSTLITFAFFYLTLNIALMLNGETVSTKQKLKFVLILTVFQQVQIYLLYAIGIMEKIGLQAELIVTIPNPLTALLFYFMMVKLLGLSKYRILNVLNEVYLYGVAIGILADVISNLLFAHSGGPYNYMLDLLGAISALVLNIAAYCMIRWLLRKYQVVTRLNDAVAATHYKRNFALSIFGYCVVYLFAAVIPAFNRQPVVSILRVMVVFLILALYITLLFWKAQRGVVKNKDVYIHSLNQANDRFNNLKYGFNDILQGYEGYISLKDLEKLEQYHRQVIKEVHKVSAPLNLSKRLDECPALVSILIDKYECADDKGVEIKFGLSTGLELNGMNELDACRCISCLLDNAIEGAAQSEEKVVRFSYQKKTNGRNLYIISNTVEENAMVAQESTFAKENSVKGRIKTVRKIVGKYPNCTFNISTYQTEHFVYLDF